MGTAHLVRTLAINPRVRFLLTSINLAAKLCSCVHPQEDKRDRGSATVAVKCLEIRVQTRRYKSFRSDGISRKFR